MPQTPVLRALKTRMRHILRILKTTYPDADCALTFQNAFEVLIATILSAQTTDASVNAITPALFGAYPTPQKLALAKPADVEAIIRTIGLYHNKTKNIIATARALTHQFSGKVPETLEELISLPGVGRKTANCVLVNAYGKPGIMCDTHCCRVSKRIGLTESSDPVKIEADLGALMPPEEWGAFSHRIIIHGRRICHARKPDCHACPLVRHCITGSSQTA